MCRYCDYNSEANRIFVDPLDGEYYLDIETYGFVHKREYIDYCPWCGRKLGEKCNDR